MLTPAKAFYSTKRGPINLPHRQHRSRDHIARVAAPGSYILTAHLSAVSFGSNGYVRCGIEAAGKSSFGHAGSAAEVGQSQSDVEQIYVSLPVTSPYTFKPKVVCRQDSSTPRTSKKRG